VINTRSQSENLVKRPPAISAPKKPGFRVLLRSDEPGVIDIPGLPDTYLSIHVGPSVNVKCRRGGQSHRGLAVHGDIDIIPAGTPSRWETQKTDTALVLGLSGELIKTVLNQSNLDSSSVEIRNRFQVRDPQLENIGWALKAEMESGYPSGRLYLDSLAVSIAARIIHRHSSLSSHPERQNGHIPARMLKKALSFVEDNLSEDISLNDIAAVTGLSSSHFKRLFREATGLPVHQYLIRRRVDRAKCLLIEGSLPISQIALETGFAHQSQLAYHMRRLIGVSPKLIRNAIR